MKKTFYFKNSSGRVFKMTAVFGQLAMDCFIEGWKLKGWTTCTQKEYIEYMEGNHAGEVKEGAE